MTAIQKRSRAMILVSILLMSLLFVSCLPGDGKNTAEKPANFLTGIWHGWVAPVSVIVGIFKPGIRVYETNNTGWWYDLGFYMAVVSGFGGIAFSRRSARKRDR